jgi:hypothetical protein
MGRLISIDFFLGQTYKESNGGREVPKILITGAETYEIRLQNDKS